MKGETIKPVFIENTMNANELADDLDNANGFQYLAQLGLASQAATMLRQQQAQIKDCKYVIERLNSVIRKNEAEIEALKNSNTDFFLVIEKLRDELDGLKITFTGKL